MNLIAASALLIPFFGTALGSGGVFCLRREMSLSLRGLLCSFAAGVMTAASVWSLLIPAMDPAYTDPLPDWVPVTVGFWIGTASLLAVDRFLSRWEEKKKAVIGRRDRMLLLAVTVHNLPEGMAVGAVVAGYLFGQGSVSSAEVVALAIGIALQNLPEGAIVSMPLKASGYPKGKAFAAGVLSGAIEPVGGLFMLLAAELLLPVLPYLLGFAAGAMLYVVIVELLPEAERSVRSVGCVLSFSLGFTGMMLLDHILSA